VEADEPSLDPRVGGILVEIESTRAALQSAPDARTTALDRLGIDVVDPDRGTRLQRELGDPCAHRPGPDDAHRSSGSAHRQTGLMASNGRPPSGQ